MRRGLAIAAIWVACAAQAHAWGDQGHRVTGFIAGDLLTEATRAQLIALLGHDDLAQVSTWMDDERESLARRLPGSARWHYENRSACGSTKRACDGNHCVTARIEHYRTELKNRRNSRTQRAEAVRVLVHLIGDLHQPLHLSDNADRGGNDLFVILPGERDARRLHEAWDSRFLRLEMGRRSAETYARWLAPQRAATRPTAIAIESWAAATFQLGKQAAYGALPGFACGTRNGTQSRPIKLDEAYVRNARAVTAGQLALAGERIALLLNDALGK